MLTALFALQVSIIISAVGILLPIAGIIIIINRRDRVSINRKAPHLI